MLPVVMIFGLAPIMAVILLDILVHYTVTTIMRKPDASALVY